MWKFSNARGLRMALIPCICLGARTERLLCFALFYTGVGYCIVCSCIGLSTTFIQINEMGSTLSVYLPQPFWSWWLFLTSTFMRFITSNEYIAPDVYIVETVVEAGFAGSTLEDIEEERPEIGW